MNNNEILNEKIKEVEEKWWRNHDRHLHFERFEYQIQNLLAEVTPEIDIIDVFKYARMIHSLFVFSIKDKFNETNENVFYNNTGVINFNNFKQQKGLISQYLELSIGTQIENGEEVPVYLIFNDDSQLTL